MSIADAIKTYRKKQGLTQFQLATRLDKTVRSVQRYEKGDVTPSVQVINQIFNIKVEDAIINELVEKRGV